MSTWEEVHAGDIVRGPDDLLYGVAWIEQDAARGPRLQLRRNGELLAPAQLAPGTNVTIHASTGVALEAEAWQVLADAGFGPQVLGEYSG